MNRTKFHKCLLSLTTLHDMKGIRSLSKDAGIPYPTMRKRLSNPRGLRWYEYLSIVESLRLNEEEEAALQASIRG